MLASSQLRLCNNSAVVIVMQIIVVFTRSFDCRFLLYTFYM